MTWTRQQKVGKASPKSLLLLLGVLCDDDDQVKRSQTFISDILECSVSTLKVSMKHLEDGGWITREKRNGGSRSLADVITLNIDSFVSHRQVDQGVDEPAEEPEIPMGQNMSHGKNDPLHGTESGYSNSRNPATPIAEICPSYIGSNLTTKQEETTTTAADAPAEGRTARDLLGEWIDHCDPKPPSRVTGQMAREIKNLLAEGIAYDDVRDGLIQLHQRGTHPSTLPSFVHSVRQRPVAGMTPSGKNPGTQPRATGTQRAMEALAAGASLKKHNAAQQLQIGDMNGDGRAAGQRALGEGSLGGQQDGGRSGDPDVVGNPRPFEFQ